MSPLIAPSNLRRCFLACSHKFPRWNSIQQISTVYSILPDDIYDVVVVGGGITGLALTASLGIMRSLQTKSKYRLK
jgi:NADPH-dependent 2,4-dienoyl-CoA reductase/sulfur reductase-like enzyme